MQAIHNNTAIVAEFMIVAENDLGNMEVIRRERPQIVVNYLTETAFMEAYQQLKAIFEELKKQCQAPSE